MMTKDWEGFESPHEHKVPAEALEQPVVKESLTSQEPVAWTITGQDGVTVDSVPDYAFYSELDAIKHRDEDCFIECNVVPLYTHPKQWQGLSDEEVENIWNQYAGETYVYIRALEAKLKEKNT